MNVKSLWPDRMIDTCSGTSFAAARLAEILAKGMPRSGGFDRAQADPSAIGPTKSIKPSLSYIEIKKDKIGVVP